MGRMECVRWDCEPLAGKSTLNRMELSANGRDPAKARQITVDFDALDELLVELYLVWVERGQMPKRLVLDIDATDVELHGRQEHRFYHGYYHGILLPSAGGVLQRLAGTDGAAHVERRCGGGRGGDDRAARGPVAEAISAGTDPLIRADGAYCRDELMTWCEARGVDDVLGLPRNDRLQDRVQPLMDAGTTGRQGRRRTGGRRGRPMCDGRRSPVQQPLRRHLAPAARRANGLRSDVLRPGRGRKLDQGTEAQSVSGPMLQRPLERQRTPAPDECTGPCPLLHDEAPAREPPGIRHAAPEPSIDAAQVPVPDPGATGCMTLAAERADLPAPGCSAIRRPARKKAGKTHACPPSEAFSNSRRDIPCPVPHASREKHHFRLGYEKSGLNNTSCKYY